MSDLIDKQTAIKIAESYGLNNGTTLGRHSGIADLIAEELRNLSTIELYGTWIPCSERLPKVETEVWITAKRRYSDGTVRYITTTAIYEDGTMLEEDSEWFWHDLDGEYDEEHDCYIIPEGWWECRHYHRDEEYDNLVDDEVIAWMPLPETWKGEER